MGVKRQQEASKNDLRFQRTDVFYGTDVLVGNWYENRFSDKTDRKAITPCIYGQSSCSLGTSSYSDDFKATVDVNNPEEVEQFLKWKEQSFDNRLSSQVTNLKLFHGEPFLKNMTTMTDIFFRLKPKAAAQMQEFNLLKKKPKEDLMKSYGNTTNYGLRDHVLCELLKWNRYPTDVSVYKQHYIPKQLPREKKEPKCERKTSI